MFKTSPAGYTAKLEGLGTEAANNGLHTREQFQAL